MRRPEKSRLVRCAVAWLGVTTALSLAGCSSVRLADDAREKIRTIHVSPEIVEEGSYSGSLRGVDVPSRGAAWYSLWFTAPVGMMTDLICWSENEANRRRSFVSRMRKAEVFVGDVVRNTVEASLRRGMVFASVVDRGGDAELRLAVEYGIDDGMGLRGTWKPWLEIEGTLVAADGDVLWRRAAAVGADDPRLPEFHDPFRRPDRLRAAYTKAARIISRALIADLQGE